MTRPPRSGQGALGLDLDPEIEGKRRAGGGKLSRSETVTVRLDPKLRYLAELAARKQRRTLSSFIEWAIEESLKRVHLQEAADFGSGDRSIADEAAFLWDVDEPDRFAKLALRHPDMLTHDEQVLWKLVRDNGFLWKGKYASGQWTWNTNEASMIYERLREHWTVFNAVVRGQADKSKLPSWAREQPTARRDMDDEIPF